MIYKKPYNVKYTDMAIYIDEHHNDNEDTVFKYLYHIAVMLARKSCYFMNDSQYDDFGIYVATRMFERLRSKTASPVKSILNYMKSMLHNLYIDFINDPLYFVKASPKEERFDYQGFNNVLIRSVDSVSISDFQFILYDITRSCRKFLETIPYKKDSVEWTNIYISVLLTFVNSFLLTKSDNKEIVPILFHLPEYFSNYVIVLTNQLRHVTVVDLQEVLHTRVSSDSLMNKNIFEDVKDFSSDDT